MIGEVEGWQRLLGEPPEGEELAASDPRRLVAETLNYLRNNQERMAYPRYRQTGLPVTSSLVESLVGEFNARLKAGRSDWDRLAGDGGEAMLQLRRGPQRGRPPGTPLRPTPRQPLPPTLSC